MTDSDDFLRLEDLTWTEFGDRAPTVPYWIVIAGSIEQHGPHLPLGSDTLVVERLAQTIAARHRSIILGSIRIGVLHAFKEWPGSQRVSETVLAAQLESLVSAATPYRNNVLVLNGHDENHEPLMLATRSLVEKYETDLVLVEWAQLVGDVIRDVSDFTSESHAGEGLTSVFMHWYPTRVRRDQIGPGTMPEGGLTADDLHQNKLAHHIVTYEPKDIPTGVLGDPRYATAEKGRLITDALVGRVDTLVRERGWL